MVMYRILAVSAIFFLAGNVAKAGFLTPSSISAQGTFTNSENLVIDGSFPTEGSVWTGAPNAYWRGQTGASGVAFTIDYGAVFSIEDVTLSIDNNDDYRVEASVDGLVYSTLFDVSRTYGEIGWGMDTMSSIQASPEYVAPIDFIATSARYLRIFATGGDGLYSVGELQAFGVTVVPEPTTVALWSIGLAGMALVRRRS